MNFAGGAWQPQKLSPTLHGLKTDLEAEATAYFYSYIQSVHSVSTLVIILVFVVSTIGYLL